MRREREMFILTEHELRAGLARWRIATLVAIIVGAIAGFVTGELLMRGLT